MLAGPLLEQSGISGESPVCSILHLAQVTLDRCIVLRRQGERVFRELASQLIRDRLMLIQFPDQHIVLGRSGQRRDPIVQEHALRRSTDQSNASNIDIVDRPSQIPRVALHDLPKRIQVYNDKIYWLDRVLLQILQLHWIVPVA